MWPRIVNCWVGDCADNTLGLGFLFRPELPMDARHHEVEPSKHILRVIKRTVRQHVGLNALENSELAGVSLIERFGFGLPLLDLFDRRTAGVMC